MWETSVRAEFPVLEDATVILDDLFSQAALDYKALSAKTPLVKVQCTYTSNQTGGFQSNTNASATDTLELLYSPSQSVGFGEFTPPSFTDGSSGIQ
jgi:hypothetical protein